MQEFRDKTGRKWQIDLNFGAVLRIKSASGGKFNLLDDGKGNLGQTLWADLGELYEVLWYLVEPQASKRSPPVTADEFGEALAAECIIEARQKFFTEYIEFFQSLQRPETAMVLEKMLELNRRTGKLTLAKMTEAMSEEQLAKAMAKIEKAANLAFGSFRESLDSIPVPTPGDNST